MKCEHPIDKINATVERGMFRCTACKGALATPGLLRALKRESERLSKLERFASLYLNGQCCEGCGEWATEGFVSLSSGSHCPGCFSDMSVLDESETGDDLESVRAYLSAETLEKFPRWRRVYNDLHLDWPELFPGYVATDWSDFIALPSVGSKVCASTLVVYPSNIDGSVDFGNGTHLDDCCEDWFDGLRDNERNIIHGIRLEHARKEIDGSVGR